MKILQGAKVGTKTICLLATALLACFFIRNVPKLKDTSLQPSSNLTTAPSFPQPHQHAPQQLTRRRAEQRDHGITVPVLSPSEHDNIPWSSEIRIVRRGDDVKVYHNYTLIAEQDGVRQVHFIKSEVIPKTKHLLHPRGFTNNFNLDSNMVWSVDREGLDLFKFTRYYTWKFQNPRGKVTIYMCYENADSMTRLWDKTGAAMDMWHLFLGSNRGVEFNHCLGLCGEIHRTHSWVVRIIYKQGVGLATPGFKPYHVEGRHMLYFDPDFHGNDYIWSVAALAHELGHIMGLWHEHQRYDAPQNLELHCPLIPGYSAAKALWQRTAVDPSLFDEIVCKDYNAAVKFIDVNMLWEGLSYIPFAGPVRDIIDAKLVDQIIVAEFDWDSIMLYHSGSWDEASAVMTRRESKTKVWRPNLVPSLGDVRAVKAMYPDI